MFPTICTFDKVRGPQGLPGAGAVWAATDRDTADFAAAVAGQKAQVAALYGDDDDDDVPYPN